MVSLETYTHNVTGEQILYKELFGRIALGDEVAFKILFETYRSKFYSAVFHITKSVVVAEELTQEAFINIWRSRAGLAWVDNPNAYLYRIIINLAHTYLCKESNETQIRYRARCCRGEADYATIELLEARETEKLIAEVVDRLPRQQKTVYRLSREKGMKYQEIAAELKISPNTARNHLIEALKSVRIYLKGHTYCISALILDALFS
jgi:RNA polymerase sigma-70 factor (ECF subfamily)